MFHPRRRYQLTGSFDLSFTEKEQVLSKIRASNISLFLSASTETGLMDLGKVTVLGSQAINY